MLCKKCGFNSPTGSSFCAMCGNNKKRCTNFNIGRNGLLNAYGTN